MAKSKPKTGNTQENKPRLNEMMERAMQNETFRKLYIGPDSEIDKIIISIIPKAKPQANYMGKETSNSFNKGRESVQRRNNGNNRVFKEKILLTIERIKSMSLKRKHQEYFKQKIAS